MKNGSVRKRSSQGFVTLTVLGFMLLIGMIIIAIGGMTQNQYKSSQSGLIHTKALTLAESGMDDAIDHLTKDQTYTGTGTQTVTLYEDAPTNTKPLGTFTTTVSSVDTWTRQVTSTGTSIENGVVKVTGVVSIQKSKLGADGAAIKSNGDSTITGNATILTTPIGLHKANVQTNGTISVKGSAVVDGTLFAVSGVLSGQGYFPNQQPKTPYSFLSQTTTDTMKQNFIAQAMAGGVMSGVTSSAVISGSKYISGDLTLGSSDNVVLQGGANAVIFVNGNVTLTAKAALTNGVTLIVNGTFSQTGQSTYKITNGTPTPTLFVYNSYNSATAIKLAGGGVSDAQGIVYSVKGDIDVAGNSTLTGALYCGDANAGVKCTGSFTQYYPLDMASIIDGPGGTTVTQILEL